MENVFHYNSRKTSPKTTKKVKKVEKFFFACLFYKYIVLLRKIGKCFLNSLITSKICLSEGVLYHINLNRV